MKISIPLFISSDTTESTNIINKNALGSQFDVLVNPPIVIPKMADNLKVYANSLTYWYNFPNISVTKANNWFCITTTIDTVEDQFQIPDGLYSLSELELTINALCTLGGLPADMVLLRGITATQKIEFTILVGYQMLFTMVDHSNDLYQLLGLDANTTIPDGAIATSNNNVYTAPNVAQFSSFSNVLLHCSLCTQSIVNGRGSDIIVSSAPTVAPGLQQAFEPKNLLKVPANNLKNQSIGAITIKLTDQNNNLLDTNSENFYTTIVIEYEL